MTSWRARSELRALTLVGLMACGSPSASADDTASTESGESPQPTAPSQICLEYIDCIQRLHPQSLSTVTEAYGAGGSCWAAGNALAEACSAACSDAVDELCDGDAPMTGGQGSTTQSDTTPDLTTSGGDPSESSSSGPQCPNPANGSWDACVDASGLPIRGACDGGAGTCVGGAVVGNGLCTVIDCADTCDCFAPPPTGTAEVLCLEILKGGGTACVLDCSNGQTCPDGMLCERGLCFHGPL
jgi:hypothetical protein